MKQITWSFCVSQAKLFSLEALGDRKNHSDKKRTFARYMKRDYTSKEGKVKVKENLQ
jgi:hypothetical protein